MTSDQPVPHSTLHAIAQLILAGKTYHFLGIHGKLEKMQPFLYIVQVCKVIKSPTGGGGGVVTFRYT